MAAKEKHDVEPDLVEQGLGGRGVQDAAFVQLEEVLRGYGDGVLGRSLALDFQGPAHLAVGLIRNREFRVAQDVDVAADRGSPQIAVDALPDGVERVFGVAVFLAGFGISVELLQDPVQLWRGHEVNGAGGGLEVALVPLMQHSNAPLGAALGVFAAEELGGAGELKVHCKGCLFGTQGEIDPGFCPSVHRGCGNEKHLGPYGLRESDQISGRRFLSSSTPPHPLIPFRDADRRVGWVLHKEETWLIILNQMSQKSAALNLNPLSWRRLILFPT